MLWLKALHIIFMVAWFAGLFYLPRLFVYHAVTTDDISDKRFRVMERKLYYGIMTPAGLLTLGFGFWMLLDYAWLAYGTALWLHIKLMLLCGLVLYHVYCGYLVKQFAHNQNKRSHVFFRWFNELPVLFLVAIVLLATVRPT